ncbi:MAG: type II toxin-antitoxin system prevent-host-death family antitoxin [Caldilineaceae bacterium]
MTALHIGAEQFRRQLTELLNRVSYGGEHIIIERHSTPLAALIPFELYEALLAADIPSKLAAIAETDEIESTEELAAAIEAALQMNSIAYPTSIEQMEGAQSPTLLRETAEVAYEINPLGNMAQNVTFTLEEAAMYLKLPIDAVEKQAALGQIPGRRVNDTWRFLKSAIDRWLGKVDGRQVLLQQAGTFAHDESLAELRRTIYQARGRSESETEEVN